MRLLMPKQDKDDGFKVSEIRSVSQDSIENEVPTSGFQTMQLSNAERSILQELSKVQSSLVEIQQRVDHRSNRLEKYIEAIDDGMNSRISAIELKLAARDQVHSKMTWAEQSGSPDVTMAWATDGKVTLV